MVFHAVTCSHKRSQKPGSVSSLSIPNPLHAFRWSTWHIFPHLCFQQKIGCFLPKPGQPQKVIYIVELKISFQQNSPSNVFTVKITEIYSESPEGVCVCVCVCVCVGGWIRCRFRLRNPRSINDLALPQAS